MADKLTNKQALFVKEYLIDLNATQAAKRAGYSQKTAHKIGQENLIKPAIQKALSIAMQKRSERTEITADYVLEKAMESFEFNAQPIHDKSGNVRMVNAAAAAKFLELTGRHVRIKAFESEQEKSGADEMAEALNKLVDKLPGA